MSSPRTQVFGIRHHGPGSARSLRRALASFQPDVVLVEGPPDAAEVLPLLTHAAMQPPVALLLYDPEKPRRAVYYPFTLFSPEWQALHYALDQGLPARFMDLPQAHQLALAAAEEESVEESEGAREGESEGGTEVDEPDPLNAGTPDSLNTRTPEDLNIPPPPLWRDPLRYLAEAAGFSDSERWWERMVEHRRDDTDLFAAILEAMTALRAEVTAGGFGSESQGTEALPVAVPEPREMREEALREAFMRQTLRSAQREGFQRIAVVCGAWHAPALAEMPPAKADAELLKGLPKLRVRATWIPWTYGRLTRDSGYGAGIAAPGWYHHLWRMGEEQRSATEVVIRWATRAARLLREEQIDASSAHIIEAVRLAETLAALRGEPLPGLSELNEALRSVLLGGDDVPMRLIAEKMIVGERLGSVPEETPAVPLQADLQREQRRLRLAPEAFQRDLDLDLRRANDLERSHMLHRLALLGVRWGEVAGSGGGRGTFREKWKLQWRPELAVAVIEAGVWGNTLPDAATAFTRDAADRATALPALTGLVERALLADLPDAVRHLMDRVARESALASDVGHLMDALPPLANVLRYGNVRQTDTAAVGEVVDGLVARICIGLTGACASLNDEAAAAMFARLLAVHAAVTLLQAEAHLAAWHRVLQQLADQQNLHGLVAGRACRLLLDAGDTDAAARRMSLALSRAVAPEHAAAWVEGFLKGSGLLLLHDETLWQILDAWVTELPAEAFTALLPLLRRTFATFAAPERRQMGERVRRGLAAPVQHPTQETEFDTARAEAVLPLVARLLGLDLKAE